MILQILVFTLSITAMYLIARTDKWKKWGYPIGLASQPFWFLTTIPAKQYGLIALSSCYTIIWCYGIYNYFIKGKTKKEIWSDLLFWNDNLKFKE